MRCTCACENLSGNAGQSKACHAAVCHAGKAAQAWRQAASQWMQARLGASCWLRCLPLKERYIAVQVGAVRTQLQLSAAGAGRVQTQSAAARSLLHALGILLHPGAGMQGGDNQRHAASRRGNGVSGSQTDWAGAGSSTAARAGASGRRCRVAHIGALQLAGVALQREGAGREGDRPVGRVRRGPC